MHLNDGACQKCLSIFQAYPNFDRTLFNWFLSIQTAHPEAHISCAGRGKVDQQALFNRGASKAMYGYSAHNFNAAIDIFRLLNGNYDIAGDWFSIVIEPNLTADLCWYGRPKAPYYERPHVELAAWPQMVKSGILKLVE